MDSQNKIALSEDNDQSYKGYWVARRCYGQFLRPGLLKYAVMEYQMTATSFRSSCAEPKYNYMLI